MPPANSPVEIDRRLTTGTHPYHHRFVPSPPAQTDSRHLATSNAVSTSITRTPSPSSFVSSLSNLSSSVQDLASTLTVHSSVDSSDDAEMENLSFLRHPTATVEPQRNYGPVYNPSSLEVSSSDRQRRGALQPRERSLSNEIREQRRLRERHLRQDYDSHEAWAESMQARLGATQPRTVRMSDVEQRQSYAEGVPIRQHQYGWAPGEEEGEEDELEEVLTELREQQPNTHPDILRVLGRAQLETRAAQLEIERSRRSTGPPGPRPEEHTNHPFNHSSLRTAAILSSVRRNRQLSARSRDMMQRYVMDRERGEQTHSDGAQDPHASSTAWTRNSPYRHEQHTNRYELNRLAWQASQRPSNSTPHPGMPAGSFSENPSPHTTQNIPHIPRSAETLETLRRRYLEDPNESEAQAVARFETTIRTLDAIRHPDNDSNDIKKIINQHTLRQSELSGNREYVDERGVERIRQDGMKPPFSSFLRKGVTFSGFQQAAPQIIQTLPQSASTTNMAPSGTLLRSSDTGGRTTLYRFANNEGQTANAPVDLTATAAARAVWNGGRDGSSHRRWRGNSQDESSRQAEGLRRRDSVHRPAETNSGQDRWAVRVQLHNVDYDSMTLQGTMEAFNVPQGSPTQLQYPTSSVRSTQRSSRGENGTEGATTTARETRRSSLTYVIPDSTVPKTTTFSTYLEGEIIDLDQHTLLTTNANVQGSATDDAKYWRRLPPFSQVQSQQTPKGDDSGYDTTVEDERKEKTSSSDTKGGDDALLAAMALNPHWLQKAWQEKYILMRWKELCFVPPTSLHLPSHSTDRNSTSPTHSSTSNPQIPTTNDEFRRNPSGELETRAADGTAASTPSFGLSIKGFYFVSLRRSDGKVEGLYFDPHSSPYQRLEMGVEKGAMGGGVPVAEWA